MNNSSNSSWRYGLHDSFDQQKDFGKSFERGSQSGGSSGDYYNRRRGGYKYRGGVRRDNSTSRRERWNNDCIGAEEKSFKRGRGRHPPGLQGKEIGMWYAQRSRAAKVKPRAPELAMETHEANALNEALDEFLDPCMKDNDSTIIGKLEPQISPLKIKKEGKYEENDYYFDISSEVEETKVEEKVQNYSMSQRLSKIEESDFKTAYKANVEENQRKNLCNERRVLSDSGNFKLTLKKNEDIDMQLYDELIKKKSLYRYQDMIKFRKKLPSYKMREEILNLIHENQVVVLSGETGCGKTTQVAQFILDDCIEKKEGSTCQIICTQPRRISAISVAQRVADERAEILGRSVGYQIRLEKIAPRTNGSILYCTTGIVLQWLISDPVLSKASHLILDEIHERDSLSDFLICISRDILPMRPDLKLVLMSATLNADQFSKYFSNCPMIHIPGFTYNVRELFLEDVIEITKFSFLQGNSFYRRGRAKEKTTVQDYEDFIGPHLRNLEASKKYSDSTLNELYNPVSEEMNLDLILSLLSYIAHQPSGAVLIFLPGWENISKLSKMIDESSMFCSSRFRVIPLHSLMPTANQREVFDRPPPGVRKIVIATNIAETSITIDDIVYVIDCGRIKQKNYDKNTNISTLLAGWETLANARQRKGRAGRVQEGTCFHLYTRAREMTLHTYPVPEIQRTRLEEVILQVKILKLGLCKQFLSKLMEAPEESVVDVSLKMLRSINAVDEKENLTPLGFHLAQLPMDPLTGKMLLMGAIFSCLNPILTVAASLSFKDPFVISLGNEKVVDQRRRLLEKGTKSDHLMLVNVYDGWERAKKFGDDKRYVKQNFLSSSVLMQLQNMRKQFLDHLYTNKFVVSKDPHFSAVNHNSWNLKIVKAVITAGLYPNVAQICKNPFGRNQGMLKSIRLPEYNRASLHPKSVNEQQKLFENDWLIYWEKMKSTKIYLYDTTMISNYPLLLFGEKLEYDEREKIISVDDFVKISCNKEVADVIKKLRLQLDELLEYKITHPGPTHWGSENKGGKFLSLVVQTLSSEKTVPHSSYGYNKYDEDVEMTCQEQEW